MTIAATNLLRFLGATAAIIAMAVGLNFMVDPLQLFRPARLFAAMYSPDTRMQDAGLIQSQQFDTVFMGTSLAIHFRQSDIDRIVGGRSLKLSMTGSNSREQSFVLAAAMARHPRRVIWQMDDWIFRDAPDIDQDIYLPADLYRRNAKGIASYLFSGAMARESSWIIGALDPAVRAVRRAAHHRRDVQISDIPRRRHQYASARFRRARDFTMRKAATADFIRITDPVRSAYLAEGYDYDAMVRTFEKRRDRPDREKSGRKIRYLFPALLDPAIRGDARCVARDVEDRLRFHRLRSPTIDCSSPTSPCTISAP